MELSISKMIHQVDLTMAAAKSLAVLLSYLVGYYLTGSFHDESRYFGAMLAAIASVVALQADLKTSIKQGWLRVLGTFIGAVIATLYLLLFPFSIAGLIATVFVLEIVCMMFSIPDNGKMATIALIVIMLISQKNPTIPPIVNSSLRFLETAVGVAIGISLAWLIESTRRRLALRRAAREAAQQPAPPPAPTSEARD